ncbi:MAG: D-alanyl-D-alanine carboxypeptidase [Lachnospiraceae bacterium]|nr:D-alanyl-D-alanine carboxypeptidase [Lachnospiraceae bacterium]
MNSNIDPRYDDAEYLARRERRRKKMILERKRKRRRRLLIKLGLCAAVVLTLIVSTVKFFVGKANEKKELEAQRIAAEEQARVEAMEVPEEVIVPEEVLPVYEFVSTADTKNIYSDKVISSHGILVNADTDIIVASKGAKERVSPASMTKVLTVLVAAEHVSEEQLDDTFTMTIDITDYSFVNDCSNAGFLVDEKVPVRDLFYGTILPSGGDAAVGLATYVAGSHEAFVDMMNEKLEELGISDSAHFTNCVGLYDENHYCTMYDMAIIMKAAMENELCREVLSTKCYTTTPTTEHPEGITISNWFLRRIEDKDTHGEVLGAKTGFVAQSGSCAVSYQEFPDGSSYICATAGSTSSWRCIYDHVEIYTTYVSVEETESTGENNG